MFEKPKVHLDPALYDRAAAHATKLGYPSLEAYVAHLLERELKTGDDTAAREKILEKLKGLGYMT